MRLPFLEFVQRRFHYELDKTQEEFNRALGRMEDAEFERGFIAGLERGLYLIKDSKESWGNNPLDDIPATDESNDSDEESDDSGSTGGTDPSTGESGSEGSGGTGSGSGSSGGGGSVDDNDDDSNSGVSYPFDATT